MIINLHMYSCMGRSEGSSNMSMWPIQSSYVPTMGVSNKVIPLTAEVTLMIFDPI